MLGTLLYLRSLVAIQSRLVFDVRYIVVRPTCIQLSDHVIDGHRFHATVKNAGFTQHYCDHLGDTDHTFIIVK